jgi:hypothetical protein
VETRVWSTLDHQGRMVKWLAARTGIGLKRLYQLKRGDAHWWQDWEAEACARALDMPRDYLFPPGAQVLPPGRLRPARPQSGALATKGRGAA